MNMDRHIEVTEMTYKFAKLTLPKRNSDIHNGIFEQL